MEALYAKLYEKYITLKEKNFSGCDEENRKQEEKFLNFVSASEALTEHLRSEIHSLKLSVERLMNENTELRYTRDEELLESQKCLVEEQRKNKALSEQVQKLKELISERYQSGRKRKTPESPQVTTRSMRKRSRQSAETDTAPSTRSLRKRGKLTETEDVVETDMVSPHKSTTETLMVSQPQCCKATDVGSSNSAGCPFQDLGEQLIGMKLSTSNEGGRVCVVVSHPSSGLSFSLTLINNSNGEEDELLYNVISLGTFERVVPTWMRDVIKFSTSMTPVFFEKVSRVIKPRN